MRSEAQVTLDAALADRQCHLIGGNVDDQSTAETLQARAGTAKSALVGLDDAIAALAIQIANAEAAQAAEQRRIKAEANSKDLAAVLTNVEKLLPAWIATAREMSDLLGSLNNFHYQVGGVANYLGGVADETEAGLRVVLDDLRGAVDAVARGEQQIKIGTTAAVPPVAATPAVPPKDIFTYSDTTHAPTYRVPSGFSKEIG
jgi:chromosome segregation ATPase